MVRLPELISVEPFNKPHILALNIPHFLQFHLSD